MQISRSQFAALTNLAAKQAGQDVGWINISDAEALTSLGLARRSRVGWEITLDGAFYMKDQPPIGGPPAQILAFARKAH